jgi:hypothetical protein
LVNRSLVAVLLAFSFWLLAKGKDGRLLRERRAGASYLGSRRSEDGWKQRNEE